MQSFLGILQLLLVVQQVPAQISDFQEEAPTTVILFSELITKSMCRPMEQLVDVAHEFPEEVESIYIPACVPLWRCSGCCMDESMECNPTLERNITLQLMRILPTTQPDYVELTFVEHQSCDCRPHQNLSNDKRSITKSVSSSSRRNKNRPRRRRHKNGCGKCQFPHKKICLH